MYMRIPHYISTLAAILFLMACASKETLDQPIQISGVYPHLAYYNEEGECGTGAVVPWADRLWVITYGPHFPFGSSDKLYEITNDLELILRPESMGGTPANRMIHSESEQLFIGPYAIDKNRRVRTIPYDQMPGRHTGNARHLSDPAKKIYYGTMEEGFYEVDVNTLEVNKLYTDGNVTRKEGQMAQEAELLLGAHGKGLYSGQGVLVYSNNGETGKAALEQFDIEAGALYEWINKDWQLVRRNQFVEVTGPGGIYGNTNPETDPIWATGWDHKSIILGVRNTATGWDFYRLPKASHSYDGAHGWNTEWPRIRDIGTAGNPDYLMTMHGMFWRFPGTFTADNAAGIRPRSAYLKVIGDFARWQDQIVFGCDDSAHREFLNKRKAKGNIEGPGQSNSNLWFTSLDKPDLLGPNTASGAVWLAEAVQPSQPSEPFLFAGWPNRSAWIHNSGNYGTEFQFEVDRDGSGKWEPYQSIFVEGNKSANLSFAAEDSGEWIRVIVNVPTVATVNFSYTANDSRNSTPDQIFTGLTDIDKKNSLGGLLYGLGESRKALGVAAVSFEAGFRKETGYYELDEKMNLVKKEDDQTLQLIQQKFAIPEQVVTIDESSVLVVDDAGRRWRLPLGKEAYSNLTNKATLRIAREVATERDLFSCHGTFYELPAENADGFAKIRPIASHNFRIHDYASYRGMLIMTGIDPGMVKENPRIFVSEDGNAAIWAGVIDDLWQMGKPLGMGGPWKSTVVEVGVPSDPYLIAFYDQKHLSLSHESQESITFKIEVDPIGHGPWMTYQEVTVEPGEIYEHNFPQSFQARWIRFVADKKTKATAWLNYK